jgi:hypothetical protein
MRGFIMTKQAMGKKKSINLDNTVAGCVWYRREQWKLLQQKAADPEELESSYDQWIAQAEKSISDIENLGLTPKKIDIDVVELIRWCASNKRPLDGAARSKYAAEKLRETEN